MRTITRTFNRLERIVFAGCFRCRCDGNNTIRALLLQPEYKHTNRRLSIGVNYFSESSVKKTRDFILDIRRLEVPQTAAARGP